MIATHAFTINGRDNWELKDSTGPIDGQLRHMLKRINGERIYSLGLWKLPEGVSLGLVDLDQDRSYIQCAGSAERMTVEVRTVEGGIARQEVIGRPVGAAGSPTGDPTEVVPWDEHEVRVYPNEVFDADEAGNLFVSYYETGEVPEGYTKRLIQL